MKSLLIAVTIVAALCVMGIAAPPDERPTTTVYPARPIAGAIIPVEVQESPAKEAELRERYLRIHQQLARDMSAEELRSALGEAEAEEEWLRAKEKLQEASELLARIHLNYRDTQRAKDATQLLGVLMQHGIRSNTLRHGSGTGSATFTPVETPATRPQSR